MRMIPIRAAFLPLTPVAMLLIVGHRHQAQPAPQPAPAIVSARDCAVNTVYQHAQDDFGQRALIAATVLNRFPAPGAGIPCQAPDPASVGGTFDAYRLRAARAAVAAVETGDYDLPRACAGVIAFTLPEASPRSQCVYAGLAFTQGGH